MASADIVEKCEEFIDSEDHVEDGNSTYFNVYEHPQDSEPENDENRREGSEYENDDIKMQELLREFDLEILFTLLKFGDITYRSLKYISENDINAAIRSIAYRAEFREKLFAWRRDKYGLNDFSVLPPQKPMPLGVNNSNNILSANTNTNRVTNTPMQPSTNTKQAPGLAAPRARRLSAPKTSAAKKARVSNQSAPTKRSSNVSAPPSPTPTATRSINSPTPTLSEALSLLQDTSHPSMEFDDPLCFQPTTTSAAAAATTSASSAITPTTDSLLFEPPPKMAIGKLVKIRKKYSEESLKHAVEAVKSGSMSSYKASRAFNVPQATLRDKVKQKYTKQKNAGAPSVLTVEEELRVVDWVLSLAGAGFQVSSQQLLAGVSHLVQQLERPNKFKNGIPGRHWYHAFLQRNPSVSQCVIQSPTPKILPLTLEQRISTWFQKMTDHICSMKCFDVLKIPTRIFNFVEVAFLTSTEGQSLITRYGAKSIGTGLGTDAKNCLTLSLGASADGTLLPKYTILSQKAYPKDDERVFLQFPDTWTTGRSKSGWMNCDTFYEYIVKVFNPFLNERHIMRPVLLFLDGSTLLLSLKLSQFCHENNIILVSTIPNSQPSLQPMEAAICSYLAESWRRTIRNWTTQNNGAQMKLQDCGNVLDNCVQKSLSPLIIQDSFRDCGIFPFNLNAIDLSSDPKSLPCVVKGNSNDLK